MDRVSAPGTPPIDRLQILLRSLLDHGLQVHFQTSSITASRCIYELHDRGHQMHLQTHSIAAFKCISEFNLILACKCFSKLARLRPPSASLSSLDHGLTVHLQTRSITASKCISKLTSFGPPSPSPNSLDHGLRVYLWILSIVIFRGMSNCSQAPPAASPDIPRVDGKLYRYIDT